MIITERKLKGVFEITLQPRYDARGFFMRAFDLNIFKEHGLDRPWVQENHSRTGQKDVIRGLHFQFPPFAETKLIRCVRGAFLDVFVDLRKNSPTFGKWDSVELTEDNMKVMFIPRGFAHGFYTLTELSEAMYKVDSVYSPQHECGILWNDETLNIEWPSKDPILSEKDLKNMTIKEFISKHGSIDV
jgi:dTDP-4-dehydrorhamnose 3,5-epimerase